MDDKKEDKKSGRQTDSGSQETDRQTETRQTHILTDRQRLISISGGTENGDFNERLSEQARIKGRNRNTRRLVLI